MATASEVLKIAAKEIGYSRWTDNQPGTKYGRWYAQKVGDSYYGTSGVPYCAMFVSWVMDQANQSCPGIPGAYCPWIVTAGRNSDQTVSVSQAKAGDVVLFDWGGDGVSDHIGFVESNNGSYLTCIEGNTTGTNGQSGGVNRRTRAYSTVICVIRPKYSGVSTGTGSNSGSSVSTGTSSGQLSAGTYTIQVNNLNVRTAPSTSASSVAKYNKGDKVVLDGWSASADGWIWGRYIGGTSGQYRYIAVKSTNGSTVYASISGSSSNSGSSNSGSGSAVSVSVPAGQYQILTNNLNIRTGATTSAQSVGKYNKGDKVNLDGWSTTKDGWVWGRYKGASSGQYRYIAVRSTNGNTVYAKKL